MNKCINLLLLSSFLLASFGANSETKRALLVGISDYGNAKEDPYKWTNISGANDIELLSPLFKNQGFQVSTLIDSQATYTGIIKALENLTKKSEKGDVVYIHFSMHGQPYEDLNGDEADGWDEALIPVDAQLQYKKDVYEGEKHLLDDELETHFNNLRTKLGTTGQLYVVLDACHSGGGLRSGNDHVRGVKEGFTKSGKEYKPDKDKENNDYFKVPTIPGQSPIVCLEACRSYESNKEVRDVETYVWYGSLSYYIAQAMKNNKAVGSDAWIEFIKNGMSSDRRLRKQNMVIEKSK